jgi:hypothetical protein
MLFGVECDHLFVGNDLEEDFRGLFEGVISASTWKLQISTKSLVRRTGKALKIRNAYPPNTVLQRYWYNNIHDESNYFLLPQGNTSNKQVN